MDEKSKVLFICVHNSGRSQIAEAFLRKYEGDRFEVESAGLEPAEAVNPLVVTVMQEEGIDLSAKKPQSVFQLFREGRLYSHVITVCDAEAEKCPIFPGIAQRWHCPFPDPAAAQGPYEEQLVFVRKVRDEIKAWILNPTNDTCSFRGLAG